MPSDEWVRVVLTPEALVCCAVLAEWKSGYQRAQAYGAQEDDRYAANYQGLVAEYGFRQGYGMPLQTVEEHQTQPLSDPDVGDHVEVRSAYIAPPVGGMMVYPGKDDDARHRGRDYSLVWTPARGREGVAVLIGWGPMVTLVPHFEPFEKAPRSNGVVKVHLVHAVHLYPPSWLVVRDKGRRYALPELQAECPHCGTLSCEHTR